MLVLVLVVGLLPGTAWAADEVREISDEAAFLAMDSAGNYKLTADITVTKSYAQMFTGTFDGDGHTVTLAINSTNANQGLFGSVGQGGTVQNLLTVGSVTGGNNTGAIAGKNEGVIQNCGNAAAVLGSTASTKPVGGIAGFTTGSASEISACYNTGTVIGGTRVGGITGQLEKGKLKNCYNTGTIKYQKTLATATGGIAGFANNTATIASCYSSGTVAPVSSASTSQVGAVIGYTTNGLTVENNYYLDGSYATDIGSNNGYSAASKTSHELKALAPLLGSTVWAADSADINGGYPILKWQSASAAEPVLTIDGSVTALCADPGNTNHAVTLTAKTENMPEDISAVSWSSDNADAVTLTEISNTSNTIRVTANKGGTATINAAVTAGGKLYEASVTIMVIPYITTAEIRNENQPGAVAIGQTVEAKVNVIGGGEYDYANYPTLTYQWKCSKPGESLTDISGATGKNYTIPTDGSLSEEYYLHVEISCGGKVVADGTDNYQAIRSEDYGKLYPVAYDAEFTLPEEVKDGKALNLPASHTVGGITADITWTDSSNPEVLSTEGIVTQPESGTTEVRLTAEFTYGEAYANRSFTVSVWSQAAVDEEASGNEAYLKAAKDALGSWYKLTPVYGTDTNVATMVTKALTAKKFADVSVAVKSVTEVYGNCGIGDEGDITYFYADPSGTQGLWFGRYNVTFVLAKEGSALELTNVPVTLYWDVSTVKNTMSESILSEVTDASILAKNDAPSSVTADLTLPKVVDGQKWTQISWTTSDPRVVYISNENQTTADTLFNPYVGKVIRGVEDKQVTLTAAFTFQRTNDVIGSEAPIVLYKTFTVTVKALAGEAAEAARDALLEKLDTGFNAVGLRDYVTGQALRAEDGVYAVSNDLLFPTTHDYGVDGKYYPVTITSNDPETIVAPDVANAARVVVYRPAVGGEAKPVTLTVTMVDTHTGFAASKDFTISVQPLTQQEITDELNLMQQVKAHYFDGIKNANSAADNITTNLHAFQEAYLDKSGSLVWVYDSADMTKQGIIPVAMDGWYDLQIWRLFKSSNAAAISHENLLVTRAENAKSVTVQSVLSSEVFGKYGERYLENTTKYAGYAALADLYDQPVSETVVVRGTKDPASSQPVAETLTVSFTLQSVDSTWIEKTSVSGLAEGATVFDVFSTLLAQNGYSYGARGSYIYYITAPDGTTLEESDTGANSGWMYKVNGVIPSAYLAACPLKNGDNIVVFFTKDYTQEQWSGSPVETETDGVLTPQVTAIDGKAVVTVTSDAVQSALSQNGGKVVIAPEITGAASLVSVSIAASAFQQIAGNSSGTLSIQSDCGSLTLPSAVLAAVSSQANGSDIKLTVETKSAKDVKLPAAELENAVIVEISISSDGKNITTFNGGEIGISIPVTGDYKAGDSYKVIVISADGTTETLVGKVVVSGGKATVEVAVKHLSTFVVTDTPIAVFDDVAADAWYYDAVQYAALGGMMKGVGETAFAPDTKISRAMFVTILYRLAGAPAVTGAVDFSDVPQGAWYTDAAVWANKTGIVDGRGNGSFGSTENVTREEAAAILYRYAVFSQMDVSKTTALSAYRDANTVSTWAHTAVSWTNASGLITGMSADTLAPKESMTRAQAALVFMRFCALIKK